MKKRMLAFLLAAVSVLSMAACQTSTDSSPVSSTVESSEAPAPTPTPTPTPEATPTPTPEPTPTPTPEPTPTPDTDADNSCFDNSAFLGNSLISDLYTYALVTNADYYFKNGLTVRSVFTEAQAGSETGTPVYDAAVSQHYDKYFLMFGLNELGWSYPEVFIDDYRTLIETLQKDEPGAEIYVQSLTPVSAERSKENLYGVTNERIVEYNDMLRELCEDMDVTFVDVAAAVCNDQGILPDGAAPDGVHLNMDYCKKWVSALRTAIEN